jgi:hypothetical protein
MMSRRGKPTIYDYMAASMLSIFTVWFWAETVETFPRLFHEAPLTLLTASSLLFYILGGAVSSFLVLDRVDSLDVTVGIRVGFISSLASAIYFSLFAQPDLNFIMALIFSFIIGGYLGARLRVWSVKRGLLGEKPEPDEGGEGEEKKA